MPAQPQIGSTWQIMAAIILVIIVVVFAFSSDPMIKSKPDQEQYDKGYFSE